MVRSVIADDLLLTYLTGLAKENGYCLGLILGQSCSGKDYVIHFAKTPPFQSENSKNESKTKESRLKSISEMDENWIADHAKQTTRMLPGGMYVLGIFIVSDEELFSPFNPKLKSILKAIHKHLGNDKYLFGNATNDKLVLNYSSKTQKYSCKCYDISTSNIQPAEFKFLPKATRWNNVGCYFKIDELRYLKKDEADCPLEKHIKVILDDIHENLESAIFSFDGEFRDGDGSLENLGKKKIRNARSNKSGQESVEHSKPMTVSIFHSKCLNSSDSSDLHKIIESSGQLRIVGQVACNLWLQPKLSITEASTAVKQDIMRSLAARFEMHWDSLTEEENSEDINCVHEPPRRVLITLPNSNITLSDYLFPGEGAQDARASFEELLDIKINGNLDIQDVEGQADISQYYKSALESDSEILPKLQTEANKFMYLGLFIGLLVLILSLVLHFYK